MSDPFRHPGVFYEGFCVIRDKERGAGGAPD
jgi:hypothetical protein